MKYINEKIAFGISFLSFPKLFWHHEDSNGFIHHQLLSISITQQPKINATGIMLIIPFVYFYFFVRTKTNANNN